MRVAIVGGGIAGLSVARALALRGATVTLVEAESHLCTHSSGRNAAIFTFLETYRLAVELTRVSALMLDTMFPEGRAGWLDPCGMFFTAPSAESLRPLERDAERFGVPAAPQTGAEVVRAVPYAPGLSSSAALFLPSAGVMDIHRVTSELARQARSSGVAFRLGTRATNLVMDHGRVRGLRLDPEGELEADIVVLAAGGFSVALAAAHGLGLPIDARRRHLVQLEVGELPARGPIVWQVDPEVYFRLESGGLLASPCDRESVDPARLAVDPARLAALGERLSRLGPSLAEAKVRASWACVRATAADGRAVLGPDPRALGLYWYSALAGHGMCIGVAAGDWLARLIVGEDLPLAAEVAPARLLGAEYEWR